MANIAVTAMDCPDEAAQDETCAIPIANAGGGHDKSCCAIPGKTIPQMNGSPKCVQYG